MSYILDALTKAAQQRDRQVPVVQRLLAPAPRTRSALSAVSGRLIAVLTVNAILLAAVLVWWLRPVPAPVPPEPIAVPAPPPPPVSPRPLVKLEPLPTPAAPVENPPTPSPSPRTGAAPAPAKPSPPPPASPPPRVGTPTIQPAPPVAARPPAPPESSGLKVEALIYADAPAERMVFINGRRYREGDSIDGRLKVEEIREDGVELSDQGRRFTLRVSR